MSVKGSGVGSAHAQLSYSSLTALSPAPLCAGEKRGNIAFATGRAQRADFIEKLRN